MRAAALAAPTASGRRGRCLSGDELALRLKRAAGQVVLMLGRREGPGRRMKRSCWPGPGHQPRRCHIVVDLTQCQELKD